MPEVKKLSLGQDNYPKAGRVRPNKPVTLVSTASVKTRPQSSAPRDSFQSGYHDPQADQMNELRRRATTRPQSSATPTVEAPRQMGALSQTQQSLASSTPTKTQNPPTSPGRTAPIEVDPGYPRATAKSGHGLAQHQHRSMPRSVNSAQVTTPITSVGAKQKYKAELTILEARKKKFDAEMKAQMKAQAKSAEARKVKAKPQVKKSHSNVGGKKAAGGAVTAVSGAVTMRNGMKNLANGNYLEGSLQLTQGSLSVADGVNDANIARKGLSGAPAGKMTTGLKVTGGVMNAGIAAYDTKQAYNAFKSGNEVEGAEKASSAVINAVSAFPPTAVIGAVGGVADWAMAASGADDAMVRALTSGKDKAYQKQAEKDMQLAKILVKTPTTNLARCNREQKQAYIRGLQGLKEYRQHFASQGNTRAVEDIDAHIARIKGAWSK